MSDFFSIRLCCDGPFRSRRDVSRILAHHAGGVAGRWQFDLLEPRLDLFMRELHGQCPFGDIKYNDVAVLHGADRATFDRFRCDMAGHQAVGGAGEAAVGKQRDGVA